MSDHESMLVPEETGFKKYCTMAHVPARVKYAVQKSGWSVLCTLKANKLEPSTLLLTKRDGHRNASDH